MSFIIKFRSFCKRISTNNALIVYSRYSIVSIEKIITFYIRVINLSMIFAHKRYTAVYPFDKIVMKELILILAFDII